MELDRVTSSASISRRRYRDACGTAHGLDLIGERWALLVMRELMLGPKRFGDLRGDLPGISANVLTQRLEGLEASGLLRRRKLPPPANAQVYELTDWGYDVEPTILALGCWAARSPAHDGTMPISAVSLMLSFRALLDAEKAEGIDARIGFRLGAESFLAHLANGRIEIERGDPEDADLTFVAKPSPLSAAIYGGQPLAMAEQAGAVRVEGDRALAERFITLFPLPPKVAA